MRRNFVQVISFYICLSILMALLSPMVLASDGQCCRGEAGYMENPLYEYHTDFSQEEAALAEEDIPEASEFESVEQSILQIRDRMEARQTVFYIYIHSADKPIIRELVQAAYSEAYANSPTTGDYLRWSWSKVSWALGETESGSDLWVCEMQCAYYDTAEQESEFKAALSALVKNLDLWECSDYMRFDAIYQYVTKAVAYDYAGLATHDDDIQGEDGIIDVNGDSDYLIYTAYDALCRGKAVCQGFSTLVYALCRSYDLSVCIQDGANHSWNIGMVRDHWYYLDATWDSQSASHSWFLKGSNAFAGHYPKDDYKTVQYVTAHPIAETDYLPVQEDSLPVLPFRDVKADAYYYSAVQELYTRRLMLGVDRNAFGPELPMTRAMVVTVLYRHAGAPQGMETNPFEDVSASAYYYDAVNWAVENQITSGTSETTFSPDALVTREQLATFLFRYATALQLEVESGTTLQNYRDASSVSEYAVVPMEWAVENGLILGTSTTTLSPLGTATRCQVAAILYRFFERYSL